MFQLHLFVIALLATSSVLLFSGLAVKEENTSSVWDNCVLYRRQIVFICSQRLPSFSTLVILTDIFEFSHKWYSLTSWNETLPMCLIVSAQCFPYGWPIILHVSYPPLQETCCVPCSMLSATWQVTGCRQERFTLWCTTTTRTGRSLCCCWTLCRGTSVSTSTPSLWPARGRTTSPVSHCRKSRRMTVLHTLLGSEINN